MVYRQVVSVDGQPSERERQISAMQRTVGTLSIDGPTAKSSIVPPSISADDEIGEFEGASKLIKNIILCNLYIFPSYKKYSFEYEYVRAKV